MLHTQLRSFHAVASRGGFTAAGNALHVGQPTITRQVRELEERFGVELFYRRGRVVQLTPAGRELLSITRRIFTLEEEAYDLLNATGGFHTGHLELGAVGPYHVTEMLASFHEHYPDITISVKIGNSREMLEGLQQYKSDVAVLAEIGSIEEDDRFVALSYAQHHVVAFVNSDHPWAQRTSVKLRDFEGQRVILREPGSNTRQSFEAAIKQAGVRIDAFLKIGSREAIWWAVLQGLGIGVVSEYEFIPHERLHKLTISNALVYNHQYVVCLTERRQAPLIRAFFEIAEELAHTRERSTRPSIL